MEIVRLNDVAVVRCAGRITHGGEATQLHQTVAQLLAEHRRCVLNFGAVTRVDARGLGALAELSQQARARRVSLRLASVNPGVQEVLRLTGLHDLLEIFPSEQAAVAGSAVA